jgi:hypothetical protein
MFERIIFANVFEASVAIADDFLIVFEAGVAIIRSRKVFSDVIVIRFENEIFNFFVLLYEFSAFVMAILTNVF